MGRRHVVQEDIGNDGRYESGNPFHYDELNFAWTRGMYGETSNQRMYLYGPLLDQVLADWEASQLNPDEAIIPLTDHLGSPTIFVQDNPTTDATDNVSHRTYGTFGELPSSTGTAEAIDHIYQPEFGIRALHTRSKIGYLQVA